MPLPVITPEKFLGRDSLPSQAQGCLLAVVGFCPFHDMRRKLSAEPLTESLFSHLDNSHQFLGHLGSTKVLALECLYGGPVSATVLEELAHYGIKKVLGYGYAGSLTRTIPVGQIVLAEQAFVSDGASREYVANSGGAQYALPDRGLVQRLRNCASTMGVSLRGAKVWTTDAIYREYPEKVAAWAAAGADIVNMDTSHFYVVSSVTGMSAAYVCVISDCVESPLWEDGFHRIRPAMSQLQDVVVAALGELGGEATTSG